MKITNWQKRKDGTWLNNRTGEILYVNFSWDDAYVIMVRTVGTKTVRQYDNAVKTLEEAKEIAVRYMEENQ